MPSSRRAVAGWVALAMLAGCGPAPPPRIVLITLDTTRADALGAYGGAEAATPELDRFAAEAVLFERAWATAPWTLPSHASMFTGLLPRQHGAQAVRADRADAVTDRLAYPVRPLGEAFTTLAELLAAAGYTTVGIVGGPALARELGVAQGFAHYEDDLGGPAGRFVGKRAARVADRAIHYLERHAGERLFLFVNFYDPHAPYRPPPPFDRDLPPVGDPELGAAFARRLAAGVASRPPAALPAPERETLRAWRAGYAAEVRYMDHHVGRLLRALDALPGHERSWVVVTADHGESFGEHYYLSHGSNLYEPELRVPLLVRAPGWSGGTRVDRPVQNHRLFTTLVAAAGLAPPAAVVARGLREPGGVVMTETRANEASVRAFGSFFARDLRALYVPPYKLIVSSAGAAELYDLARDAGELEDRAAREPAAVRELTARLARIEQAEPPLFAAGDRARLAPRTADALRALGYVD